MNQEKPTILICSCHSTDHQIVFHKWSQNNNKEVYMHVHLNKLPFLKRIVYAFKYIFGYKSIYGAFDEFILNDKHIEDLQNIVDFLKLNKIKKPIPPPTKMLYGGKKLILPPPPTKMLYEGKKPKKTSK